MGLDAKHRRVLREMKDKIHQQARATRNTTQIKEMKDKKHQQARATRYTIQIKGFWR